jgi:ribosomal protein L9
MNYEKVILELMTRIQALEEQVAELLKNENSREIVEVSKMSTEDIRNYIKTLKDKARKEGKTFLVLRSGDIHKELELKNYMPDKSLLMLNHKGIKKVSKRIKKFKKFIVENNYNEITITQLIEN